MGSRGKLKTEIGKSATFVGTRTAEIADFEQIGNSDWGYIGKGAKETKNNIMTKDVDKIDVSYVANLARLQLTDDETILLQGQLEQIVEYVHKIDEADVEDVEPTLRAVTTANVFRHDEPGTSLDHDVVIANAPEEINEHFMVPKILD